MAKKENTASIGFEKKIWRAADMLRGNLDAAEYKGVVLGLIFLKYISDKFETKYQELLKDEYADPEDKDEYEGAEESLIFYVPKGARWQDICEKVGLVLANGALSSQSGSEGVIRQKIVEADLVEGIVALPSQLFYNTQIPVALWFLSRRKEQAKKVLFIDARGMGQMVDRSHRELTDSNVKEWREKQLSQYDVQTIAQTFISYREGTLKDEAGFCAVKTLADIAAQDNILTPGRYVGVAERAQDGESFQDKMERLTARLSDLLTEGYRLDDEIRKQMGSIGFGME